MNALIGTALVFGAAIVIGGAIKVAPGAIDYIKSFIKWHKK